MAWRRSSAFESLKHDPRSAQLHCLLSDGIDEIFLEFVRRWQGNLKRAVPGAHIVDLPGAHHYLFQNEEAQVLRELLEFLRATACDNGPDPHG